MQKILILLCSLLMATTALIAQPANDRIEWSASRKLTWNDYNGAPDPKIGAAASTTTYLKIEYEIENGKLLYYISSTFSPSLSWVRHKTDHILGHEQGHFDIAEIFARKLHQQMKEYKFNKATFREVLGKMYNDIQSQKDALQNQYDRESNHSINKEKQKEWEEKIAKLLKETKEFSDYPRRP